MKILAFGASNSSTSINQKLAQHAGDVFAKEISPDAEISFLDLNDYEMPIYSADREQSDGIPKLAQSFKDKIAAADALIISFAEHNGHYPAAFKNIFDWASRLEGKVYQDKPVIALSTSPGAGGAASVMGAFETSAPFFGAELKGRLSVPSFYDNFDSDKGSLSNDEIAADLRKTLAGLI